MEFLSLHILKIFQNLVVAFENFYDHTNRSNCKCNYRITPALACRPGFTGDFDDEKWSRPKQDPENKGLKGEYGER